MPKTCNDLRRFPYAATCAGLLTPPAEACGDLAYAQVDMTRLLVKMYTEVLELKWTFRITHSRYVQRHLVGAHQQRRHTHTHTHLNSRGRLLIFEYSLSAGLVRVGNFRARPMASL